MDGRVSVYPLHTPAHTPPALQESHGWEADEGQASPRALEGVRASGRDGQRPDPGHRARGGARSPLCLTWVGAPTVWQMVEYKRATLRDEDAPETPVEGGASPDAVEVGKGVLPVSPGPPALA